MSLGKKPRAIFQNCRKPRATVKLSPIAFGGAGTPVAYYVERAVSKETKMKEVERKKSEYEKRDEKPRVSVI